MGKGAYLKGARFERQLKEMLRQKGYWVIRSSKSGVDGLAPDLVALSSSKKFALECKAWKGPLRLNKAKVEVMRQFENITGIPYFVAWKQPREDWRFFPLSALKETQRGHALSTRDASGGITLNELCN
ncbi:restriction endonuclease [Candidatus Micrarchaeota archaeon]|nr:restriction endonuclease [Candidatus Micrarchaeota archaeon]